MIFAGKPEKTKRTIGKVLNVYAPEYRMDMSINGRFLDRIKVTDVKGTVISGESYVTGCRVSYDANDYIQFVNPYKDELFAERAKGIALDDLFEGEDF